MLDIRKLLAVMIGLILLAGIIWYLAFKKAVRTINIARMTAGSTHEDEENTELRQRAGDALYGIGRNIDIALAEDLYRQAYANGDRLAGAHLGLLLRDLPSTDERIDERTQLFNDCDETVTALCVTGNPEANYVYTAYRYELDLSEKMQEAVRQSLRDSCQKDYPPALHLQGKLYQTAKLYEQDYSQALHWYTLCHEAGCIKGTSRLGGMYARDKHEWFDAERGLALLEEGVAGNDEYAQLRLSVHYRFGSLVEEDLPRGRSLLESSARQGNEIAMRLLAAMQMRGEGGPVDLPAARDNIEMAMLDGSGPKEEELLAELEELEAAAAVAD
ncbi:sel1 repeat family protein [bacterium]|nr:sel1 repeat family protein [bacterium]